MKHFWLSVEILAVLQLLNATCSTSMHNKSRALLHFFPQSENSLTQLSIHMHINAHIHCPAVKVWIKSRYCLQFMGEVISYCSNGC